MLSGHRDTDIIVLSKLDDKDLFSACLTSKYENKLCNETFFYNRFLTRYPKTMKFKPENLSWRKYYLNTISYIDKLNKKFNFKYIDTSLFSPEDYYYRNENIAKYFDEIANYEYEGRIPLLERAYHEFANIIRDYDEVIISEEQTNQIPKMTIKKARRFKEFFKNNFML